MIHVLIDSRATHNFINLETAKRLGCQLEPIFSYVVSVASGSKVYGSYVSKGVKWKMKGTEFLSDMLVVPIG